MAEAKKEPTIYVSEENPGFFFTVNVKNKEKEIVRKKVRFENKKFQTEDEDIIKAIDDLIASNPVFKRKIKKADRNEAEKLALAHMQSQGGAKRGGLTANAMSLHMESHQLANRDEQFNKIPPKEKAAIEEQLKEDGLTLTQSTNLIKPTKK